MRVPWTKFVWLHIKLNNNEKDQNDTVFYPAKAKISGKVIVVSSEKVTSPVYVRYAWASGPKCSLYNKEGFPASHFRTDGKKFR